MKILMIAPEPFFEPRGTPFSEYHRIRALPSSATRSISSPIRSARDVALPGLRVFRCLRPPFVRDVEIGPSLAKIPLDLTLLALHRDSARAVRAKYDAVHSHEEGSVIGVAARGGCCGVPHLYDMHSSLPQQLDELRVQPSRGCSRGVFAWIERLVIRRSKVVDRDLPAARGDRSAGSSPACRRC